MPEENNSVENKGVENKSEIDSNIKTTILHIFKPSGEELNLANKLEIDITEVTKNGIEFRTFFGLEKKMSFCFELILGDDYKIVLVAEIVDVVEDKDDYIYKCKYMHLSNLEEIKINEYLGKHYIRKEG